MTQKISRAQWEQIRRRVQQVSFVFDPKWKCLIDGIAWSKCIEHNEDDQASIIEQVKVRFSISD